jgi:hypothetical protein
MRPEVSARAGIAWGEEYNKGNFWAIVRAWPTSASGPARLWHRNGVCTEINHARQGFVHKVNVADWKGLLDEVDRLPCDLSFIDECVKYFVVTASLRTYELIQLGK